MSRDLIRLMHCFFLPAGETLQEALWHPAADVYRTHTGWLVKFDLAGVRTEDMDLSVCGSVLTVRGTRRDRCREIGCTYYRMEIAYSHFERSIELPCQLDPGSIITDYRDGMLLVRIETEA